MDATWEELEQLKKSFHSLNLEDMLHFGEKSNDGTKLPDQRTSNRTKFSNRMYVH